MTVSAETTQNEKEKANLSFFSALGVGTRISFNCGTRQYSGKFIEVKYIGFDLRWGIYYQRDNSMNDKEVAYLSEIDQPKILP